MPTTWGLVSRLKNTKMKFRSKGVPKKLRACPFFKQVCREIGPCIERKDKPLEPGLFADWLRTFPATCPHGFFPALGTVAVFRYGKWRRRVETINEYLNRIEAQEGAENGV